jgi:hypothetical protein
VDTWPLGIVLPLGAIVLCLALLAQHQSRQAAMLLARAWPVPAHVDEGWRCEGYRGVFCDARLGGHWVRTYATVDVGAEGIRLLLPGSAAETRAAFLPYAALQTVREGHRFGKQAPTYVEFALRNGWGWLRINDPAGTAAWGGWRVSTRRTAREAPAKLTPGRPSALG